MLVPTKRRAVKNEAAVAEKRAVTFKAVRNTDAIVRRDTLDGEDHLVVPMIMITEGVHNGSGGSGYYSDAELRKNPSMWNHMPIVVYHPEGETARTATVLNDSKVGVVLNTTYKKGKTKAAVGKLHAEAWINARLANAVDDRIIERIENGEMMEVSTGLSAECEEKKGIFNGKDYEWIAHNYLPDHLALLPDMEGACSIKDGAGLLRLNAANLKDEDKPQIAAKAVSLLQGIGQWWRGAQVANAATVLDWTAIKNGLTFDQIRQAVNAALLEKFGKKDTYGYMSWPGWIEDMYPESAVYAMDGTLYNQAYLIKDGIATLVGEPDEVKRVTKYQKVDGSYISNAAEDPTKGKDVRMARKDQIDALIANKESGWVEKDRDFLTNASDDQFARIENAAKKEPPAAQVKKDDPATAASVQNTQKAPTLEELLKQAPATDRARFSYMNSLYDREVAACTAAIKNAAPEVYTDAELAAMDLPALQKLAKAVAMHAPAQEADDADAPPVYEMAGGPPPATKNAKYDTEPLVRPAWNAGETEASKN